MGDSYPVSIADHLKEWTFSYGKHHHRNCFLKSWANKKKEKDLKIKVGWMYNEFDITALDGYEYTTIAVLSLVILLLY